MPNYTCSNNFCVQFNQTFSLTSAKQTFCPHCGSNTLTPPAPRVVERMVAVTEGNLMDETPVKLQAVCNSLILQFDVTSVLPAEAAKTKDYVVKLGADKSKRIDRQGPVKSGETVTHARYAVQLGSQVNAGIHMPVDVEFTLDHVRAAFRLSLQQRRYVRIYKETVQD